jgi:hypothetical protein
MMSKVHLSIIGSDKYLQEGEFGAELLSNLNTFDRADPDVDKLWKYIESKSPAHPADVIDELFAEIFKLNFDFAKSLHLWDALGIGCFTTTSYFKDVFVRMAAYSGMQFVVTMRSFRNTEEIELDLEVCEGGNLYEMVQKLRE